MQVTSDLRLKSNIPKLYFYSFFQMFLTILPVIVPFWQKKGLTLHDIFVLQGLFGATLILLDVPAGYVADLFGRKRTMIVGSIISAVGFQVLWVGQTFWHFALYEIILGVGLSLQSGCDIAILYNTLEKLNLAGRKAGYLGRRLSAMTVGEGVASLVGGFLAGIALEWPAYANAITAWIPVFVAMTLIEPEGQKLARGSHVNNFKMIRMALFGHSRLLTLAILSFIFYGFATYCAVWIFQPYWAARGLSISLFGYLWALSNFAVAVMSRFAHTIEEKIGTTPVVILVGILPIVGYLGMGFVPGLAGVVLSLAFPICRGLNNVIFQDAINTRVPAEMRATTNSVGGLGMRSLFIFFGPLIGSALDHHGPDYALKIMGVVYVIGFFVVALPLLSERSNFRMN